jgi:hypothetical protein
LSKSDHLPLPQKPETDSISSQVQIITKMSIKVDCRGKEQISDCIHLA